MVMMIVMMMMMMMMMMMIALLYFGLGKDAEVSDADDCDAIECLNGGTCYDLYFDYRCDCRAGFTGQVCQSKRMLVGD